MPFSPEKLLVCQKGDSRAQHELYTLFKAKVLGISRRFTRDHAGAEDVAQEAFIRIFRNLGQVRDVTSLEGWIRKVTIHTAIDYFQRNKRHHHEDVDNCYCADGEYDLILSNLTDDVIIRAINELPDGYRVVFNLNIIEGYSHAEIAAMLEINESTSRSQLNRARQILRQKLQAIGILRYEKLA